MTADYEVRKEPGFIYVTDSRPVTTSHVQQFCKTIPALAREAGVSKILVDHRGVPNTLDTMTRLLLASEIAKHFRGLKIAFVQGPPLRDPDLFGETVAVNRGADIRIFWTVNEACEWLDIEPANRPEACEGT